MKLYFIFIFSFFTISETCFCQQTGIACARPVRVLPNGDSTRAILASHHKYNGTEIIACLGYIDTTIATAAAIWDNFEVGLTIPNLNYHVVSFGIAFGPKNKDIKGSYPIQGCKIPKAVLKQLDLDVYKLRPGDCMIFENIRMQRNGQTYTLPLKNLIITVI